MRKRSLFISLFCAVFSYSQLAGGWALYGVDPALYATKLMDSAENYVNGRKQDSPQ